MLQNQKILRISSTFLRIEKTQRYGRYSDKFTMLWLMWLNLLSDLKNLFLSSSLNFDIFTELVFFQGLKNSKCSATCYFDITLIFLQVIYNKPCSIYLACKSENYHILAFRGFSASSHFCVFNRKLFETYVKSQFRRH